MKFEMTSNKVKQPIKRSGNVEEGSSPPKPVVESINSSSDPNRRVSRSTFSDRQTFSDYRTRATFSPENPADVLFRNTISAALGDPDNEEAWTKSLMVQYNLGSTKTVAVGSMPTPAAFARDISFWKAFIFAAVLGAILGLCAIGFMNFTDKIPRLWVEGGPTNDDEDFFLCGDCPPDTCVCMKYQNCQFYAGKIHWIAITTCAGFIVGMIRYFAKYPDNLPGLFQEVHAFHVDPTWAPYTICISAISLAGGASLGPEQGLGNLGGGLATYITENYLSFEDDDYRKLSILAGMASALGALFPSPILGVLMFQELGEPPKTYMESILVLSSGACVSFLVYYAIVNDTFISSISRNGVALSLNWEFEEWNCLVAVVIGVVSACLTLVLVIMIGITKQVFNRIRFRLEKYPLLAKIVPPMLAGVAIGAVNWALPLTVGNGNMTLDAIVRYGYQKYLSKTLLLCTLFSRMFLLGVSMNSGFVGGFIFPILTIGIIAGVVGNQMYPHCPLGLMIGCFMAAIPSAICPMPLTLSGVAIYCFFFGLYQTAPIFIAAIVSYTLIVGSGLFNELQKRAPNPSAEPPADADSVDEDKVENGQHESKESNKEKNAHGKAKANAAEEAAKQVYIDQVSRQGATISPLQKYGD